MVYGFTSKIVALQFEWHWTYPRKSLRMRAVMGLRRWAGGVRGKVEVLYQLLSSDPWKAMPLQVRFASADSFHTHHLIATRSDRERKDWEKASQRESPEERELSLVRRHIYALPPHMSLTAGPLEELDLYLWLRQKRGRQKRREAVAAPSSPSALAPAPRADDDDAALFDDDAPVSGEESLNSGDSDLEGADGKADAEPLSDDDEVVLESPLGSARPSGPSRSSSLASTSSADVGNRAGPPSPVVPTRLRCAVCFGSAELGDARSARFFSGCDRCAFIGHLACMAQVIFRQMEAANRTHEEAATFSLTQPGTAAAALSSSSSSSSSSLSSPKRAGSSTSALPAPSSASMFSSVPTSLPLIPPPSTGSCPHCHAAWSWPLLVERCRAMHVDSKGRRGGDVWYDDADRYSMNALVRQWAGRGGEEKKRRREEEKAQAPAAQGAREGRQEAREAEGGRRRRTGGQAGRGAGGGEGVHSESEGGWG